MWEKQQKVKPIAAFLILFLLGFLIIKTVYAYNAKIETATQFKLTTLDTYIYFYFITYVDYAYIYPSNLTLINVYMTPGETISTFTISALQGNLTVIDLMESNIEVIGAANTGDQSELYMEITTLDKPITVQINDVYVVETADYIDYQTSSEDAWHYLGNGKIILKGNASSTVPFTVDWTPPLPEYEPGTTYELTLFTLPITLGGRLGISTFAGGLICSLILLMMTMLPVTIINRSRKGGGGIIVELFIGLVILGVCVAITWFPIWIFVLLCFLTVLLFNGQIRGVIGK